MAELKQKNVFLTGASSGIGFATAHLLTQSGYQVWGTTRDPQKLPAQIPFHPLAMNLADPASVIRAWEEALQQAGQIDIIIQNAGSGIFGSIEDVSSVDSNFQWQVLVEGPLQILQLAAAHLRPRREGHIIGVSSLAAEMPMPFSAHYSAGKAAFSALLAGLWMELKPFGIRVTDLRPGDIRTSFNDHLPKTLPPGSAYLPWAERAWLETERLFQTAPPPELVARSVLKVIRAKKTPLIVRSGGFFQAALAPLGNRFLPRDAMLRSIRAYYGLPEIDGK